MTSSEMISSYVRRFVERSAACDVANARRLRYECTVVYAMCSGKRFDQLVKKAGK